MFDFLGKLLFYSKLLHFKWSRLSGIRVTGEGLYFLATLMIVDKVCMSVCCFFRDGNISSLSSDESDCGNSTGDGRDGESL